MKRRINLVLTLLLATIMGISPLATMSVSAVTANEVLNPSVETVSPTDSTMPADWLKGNWGTNTTAFTYDTTGHTGSRSVKVEMTAHTNGDAKWYFAPQAVTAGDQYTFSDYSKSTVATSLIAQFDNGAGVNTYVDLNSVAVHADWTQTTATFTAPAGAKNVTIFHLINAVGALSIDDASLSPVSAPAPSTPTIAIASPAANADVSGTATISANANDTNGIAGVQFKVDGANVGSEVTTAPYQTSWNTATLANGAHSITAVARNTQGTTATSAPISVTVNNAVVVPPVTPPPSTTNLISNASVETQNTTNANLPQGWLTDQWGTNTTTFSYQPTGGQDGTRSVKVQTTKYTNGDAKWYFTPQAVTIGSKYTFTDYYKSSIKTDVVAQFDNGNGVYTYLDLGTAAASASAWKQFTGSFTVPAGIKNATVFHLINGVGTLETDNFSLTTGTTTTPPPSAPTVNVTTPAGNVSGNAVQLTASASDTAGIKNVQFKVDGVNVGTADTTSPYATTWDSTTATNGAHSVTAVATNKSSVSTTSTAVSINVNNVSVPTNNLFSNPSMETADPNNAALPLGWQSNAWGTNTSTFTYLNSGAHTGSKALQVKTTKYTDGDAKWFSNPVPVTQGAQYRFSDFYKATVATEVDAAFDMPDGSTVYQIIGLPEASSTTWANFSTTFTIPHGALNMTIYHLIHGNGTLTLDDESLEPYTPVGFNRALVSLTFDDGYDTEYTNALPLLDKYGFKSTQFIVSGLVNTSGYMTTAQVQAFANAGHEIGSHTMTHTNMLDQTKKQYDKELSQSQTQLQQWISGLVTSFAFPNGLYNQAIVNDAKTFYSATRGVESGLNSKDSFNAYDIKAEDIDATTTTDQVADWVAQAQATHTWLVLVYHSIDPVDNGDYSTTPAQLDSQLAAIKNSNIPVLTMKQALAELQPQL
jgi:peptidoglycan/xylan/chitin deacetylase (PgdA/CDA1 family)